MRKTRLSLLLAVVVFGAGAEFAAGADAGPAPVVPADGILRISLGEAVRMALAQNYQIEVQSFGPRIAASLLRAESGRFDPTFGFSYSHAEDEGAQQLDPRISGAQPDSIFITDDYSAAVRGLLPWGMRVDLGIDSGNRRGTFNAFRNEFDSFAGVTLTQPLLRGFGPAANLSQIRVARTQVEISGWEMRDRVIEVVTRTTLVYLDLLFARGNLDVAHRSQGLARQLLDDNLRRVEVGVMSPLDVTSARAEVAQREGDVLVAEREVRDNENFLKQLVTREVAGLLSTRVEARPVARFEPLPADVQDAMARALELRPDYRQALLQLDQQRVQLAFARNDALPSLDLTGSFGLNGLDTALGDSLNRVFEDGNPQWRAGIVLSVPVPNREGLGRLQARKLELAQALVDLKRLEQDILVQVDNAAGRIDTARQRIVATREARILAEERLAAEQERLGAGASTTFVVLQVQRDLAQAEVAELLAAADHNKAVAEYDRRTGLTLQRYAIVIE